MESRSYVASEIAGCSAPIQRSHAPNPAIARRSGMCSRSYQSWNSSACAPEKSNAATSRPLAIDGLPENPDLVSYMQLAPIKGRKGPSLQFEVSFQPPPSTSRTGGDGTSAHGSQQSHDVLASSRFITAFRRLLPERRGGDEAIDVSRTLEHFRRHARSAQGLRDLEHLRHPSIGLRR